MASPIRCLISAGPTREFFDPVRYVSNPSSGKMGYAIAAAAARQGWVVDLISGPVVLECPEGVTRTGVITGDDMYREIDQRFDQCDILIMTAALIDFRPKMKVDHKVKKYELSMIIEMEQVVDVLATVSQRKQHQLVVGFAAETNNVEEYALRKLEGKNADFIVANLIGTTEGGFESDRNTVIVLGKDGSREEMGPALKTDIAERLIAQFTQVLKAKPNVSV